jgi:hypothetical protein
MMLFYLPAGMWEEFSNFFHSSFLEKLWWNWRYSCKPISKTD